MIRRPQSSECATASCNLNSATTLNSKNICLADGTNCPSAGAESDPTVDTSAEIQAIIGAGVYEPAGVAVADISDASANGRSLISAANYAAMRALLDLEAGVDVQAYDATLTALAAFNTNGILVQTAADTFVGRTITGTANEVSVSNGDGVSGNPTVSLPSVIDLGGKSAELPNSTSLPVTCTVGQSYMDTDATTGQRFYLCESANTWVLQGDGGGAVTHAIGISINGGGSAITTGVKGEVEVPYACTISQATTILDQSGSAVIDIWKDTYANYPPTDADSITASAPPTVSSATKAQDTTLTGWTTSVSAGDILRFNVDSATTATRATVILKCA